VGFALLQYPWTATTFAWGLAIGSAATGGTLCAHWTIERLSAFRSSVQVLAAFVVAFAVYELTLYGVAAALLGDTDAFAPRIVVEVLFINIIALVGLLAIMPIARPDFA
jgi:hypothetical protein